MWLTVCERGLRCGRFVLFSAIIWDRTAIPSDGRQFLSGRIGRIGTRETGFIRQTNSNTMTARDFLFLCVPSPFSQNRPLVWCNNTAGQSC